MFRFQLVLEVVVSEKEQFMLLVMKVENEVFDFFLVMNIFEEELKVILVKLKEVEDKLGEVIIV